MNPHQGITDSTDRAAAIARIQLVMARCRMWVCEVLLWLAECFGRHAIGRAWRAELRDDRLMLIKGLRGLLLLMALQRAGTAPPDFNRTPYMLRAPRGFARSPQRGSEERHLTRCVRFGARGLRAQFERLRTVIDTLDACADKVARLLARPFRQRGPRAVRPAAHVTRALAASVPTCADTS